MVLKHEASKLSAREEGGWGRLSFETGFCLIIKWVGEADYIIPIPQKSFSTEINLKTVALKMGELTHHANSFNCKLCLQSLGGYLRACREGVLVT